MDYQARTSLEVLWHIFL